MVFVIPASDQHGCPSDSIVIKRAGSNLKHKYPFLESHQSFTYSVVTHYDKTYCSQRPTGGITQRFLIIIL